MTANSTHPSRLKRLAVIALVTIGLATTARLMISAAFTQNRRVIEKDTAAATIHPSSSATFDSMDAGADSSMGISGDGSADMMGSSGMEMSGEGAQTTLPGFGMGMSLPETLVSYRTNSPDLEATAKLLREYFQQRAKITVSPQDRTLLVSANQFVQTEVGTVLRFLERQQGVPGIEPADPFAVPSGSGLSDAFNSGLPGMSPAPTPATDSIVRIYHLENANLQDVAKSLEVVVDAPAKFQTLESENAIIVNADTETQNKVEALIRRLDETPRKGKPPEVPGNSTTSGITFYSGTLRDDSMLMMSADVVTTRKQQVAAAIKKLYDAADDSQKKTAKSELRNLLEGIFAEDMRSRNQQLQQIEERALKLRQQYRAREDVKDQIIDLQLKVLEQDAEGLGFPEISQQSPSRAPITTEGASPLSTTFPDSPADLAAPGFNVRNPPVTGTAPGEPSQSNGLTIVDRKFDAQDEVVRDYYLLHERFTEASTPQQEAEAKRLFEAKMKLLEVDLGKSELVVEAARKQLDTSQRLHEKGAITQSELSDAKKEVQETELEVERFEALIGLYKELPQSKALPAPATAVIPGAGRSDFSHAQTVKTPQVPNRDFSLEEFRQSYPELVGELTERGQFAVSPEGKWYVFLEHEVENQIPPALHSRVTVLDSVSGKRLVRVQFGAIEGSLEISEEGLAVRGPAGQSTLLIPLDPKTGHPGVPLSASEPEQSPDPSKWRKPRTRTEYEKRFYELQGNWRCVSASGNGSGYESEQIKPLDLRIVIEGHDVTISYVGHDQVRRTANAFLTIDFWSVPVYGFQKRGAIDIDGINRASGPWFSVGISPGQEELSVEKHGDDFFSDQNVVGELSQMIFRRETPPEQSSDDILQQLQGEWQIYSVGFSNDFSLTSTQADEFRPSMTQTVYLNFSGNVVRRIRDNPSHSPTVPWGNVVLNTVTNPIQIDIVNPNVSGTPVASGILDVQGDSLRIALGYDSQTKQTIGAKRPLDFNTTIDSCTLHCTRNPQPRYTPPARELPLDATVLDVERLLGFWEMVPENSATHDENFNLVAPAHESQRLRTLLEFRNDSLRTRTAIVAATNTRQKATLDTPEENRPWVNFQLDFDSNPKTIDMTGELTHLGLYEIEGDRLRIATTTELDKESLMYPRPQAVLPGKNVRYVEYRRVSEADVRAGYFSAKLSSLKLLHSGDLGVLRHQGRFLESVGGKFYVHVHANDSKPTFTMSVYDSETGQRLVGPIVYEEPLGPLQITEAGIATKEADDKLALRIPFPINTKIQPEPVEALETFPPPAEPMPQAPNREQTLEQLIPVDITIKGPLAEAFDGQSSIFSFFIGFQR